MTFLLLVLLSPAQALPYTFSAGSPISASQINANFSTLSSSIQWTTNGSNLSYSAGNVGIGTTSPTASLFVNASSGTRLTSAYIASPQAGLILDSTSSGGHKFNLWATSTLDGSSAGGFALYDATRSSYPIFVNSSGYIGLGTTTANAPLTFANNVSSGGPNGNYANYQWMTYDGGTPNNSYGSGIEAGNIWFNTNGGFKFYSAGALISTIASNGTYSPSDARLKEDIHTLEHPLKTVLQLRPVQFQWKNHHSKLPSLGLIAQEVEPVLPEIIELTSNDIYTLNYAGMIAPIVGAIQELHKDLNTRMEALEKRLKALERTQTEH